MSTAVGIVNYGLAGNIPSIKKALEHIGADVSVIEKPADFKGVDRLILPGVGSFADAMAELEQSGLKSVLEDAEKSNLPILGICLGMQILGKIGFEFGETKGLQLIDSEVCRMECKGSIPHIGFNTLNITKPSPILSGIVEQDEFYFMHSYEVRNYTDVVALTNYADHMFVSAIQKGNVYGVQFHPEKSREAGLRVFSNFLKVEARIAAAH